jgi:hypothetical protein
VPLRPRGGFVARENRVDLAIERTPVAALKSSTSVWLDEPTPPLA